MPLAWIGPRVPGRKKARIGSWVSTWLMKTTCPPSAIARFAVSPVSAISACITPRACSTRLVRPRKALPMRNASCPTNQSCVAGCTSTTPCASKVESTR